MYGGIDHTPRVSKECGVLCLNHPSSFVRAGANEYVVEI